MAKYWQLFLKPQLFGDFCAKMIIICAFLWIPRRFAHRLHLFYKLRQSDLSFSVLVFSSTTTTATITTPLSTLFGSIYKVKEGFPSVRNDIFLLVPERMWADSSLHWFLCSVNTPFCTSTNINAISMWSSSPHLPPNSLTSLPVSLRGFLLFFFSLWRFFSHYSAQSLGCFLFTHGKDWSQHVMNPPQRMSPLFCSLLFSWFVSNGSQLKGWIALGEYTFPFLVFFFFLLLVDFRFLRTFMNSVKFF